MNSPDIFDSEFIDAAESSSGYKRADPQEAGRLKQREVCAKLLDRWVPISISDDLVLRKEGRSGPVLDEEPFEAGLKAGAFVLKVLERLARLDGLDSGERTEDAESDMVDPVELARRVQIVSPVLAARLQSATTR